MLYNLPLLSFLLIFLVSSINAKDYNNDLNLKEIKLLKKNIEPKQKTKEDYEKKEDILTQPIDKNTNNYLKKKNDLDINGSVNFDKDTKEVDKMEINLGKNF